MLIVGCQAKRFPANPRCTEIHDLSFRGGRAILTVVVAHLELASFRMSLLGGIFEDLEGFVASGQFVLPAVMPFNRKNSSSLAEGDDYDFGFAAAGIPKGVSPLAS